MTQKIRNQKGNASLFSLLALGGISIGFGLGYFIATKHLGNVPNLEDIVATYNGTGVTALDAFSSIKQQVYSQESALYEMKKRAIFEHIQSKLLEEEAKKQKTTVTALLNKNVGVIDDPSEKEMADYLQSRGINPKDKRIKKEDVKSYLKYRELSERRQEYLEKLAAQAKIRLLIPEPQENKVVLSLDGYATWGNRNAPVTVVEYSDFPCAGCAKNSETIEKLKKEFGPEKIKVIFAENPTPSNPRAYAAANAARCANEQSRFWEMRELLFQNQHRLEDNHLKEYAAQLKLDGQKFNDCLDKKRFQEDIAKSKQQAMKQGILALPSIIINGSLIPGTPPFEKVKQKVESKLKGDG